MDVSLKIYRFDPQVDREPRYQTYTVSAEPRERLLDCLNRIKWEQDGTLAYRMSCAHGVCGSDGMRINGVCGLACQRLVKEYATGEIVLEPLPYFRVLKDLIVDMEEFLERVHRFRPFLVADPPPVEAEERRQTPQERKKEDDVIRCILCACCTGACPILETNPRYVGPAALVWAYRYIYDSRDREFMDRLRAVDTPEGVWPCENKFECTRVCPKNIPVTKSINIMKREIEKTLRSGERP